MSNKRGMIMKNKEKIDAIIQKYKSRKGCTIPLLQEIQAIERYLSKEVMKYVADNTDLKLAEIYGVATFYTMFRLKPQGEHIIKVCKGTACHVSGAETILSAIRSELNLGNGEDTTSDGQFTVMEVACLGCCSLAPVIMVDSSTHGKLTAESIASVLKKYGKK